MPVSIPDGAHSLAEPDTGGLLRSPVTFLQKDNEDTGIRFSGIPRLSTIFWQTKRSPKALPSGNLLLIYGNYDPISLVV